MDKQLKIKISIDKNTGALKVVKDELDNVSSGVGRADTHLESFTKRVADMAHAAVGLYAVDKAFEAIYKSVKSLVDVSSTFEDLNATLITIEGSSKKASKSMEWITDFTKSTPYQLEQVTQSFIKLKSYGIEPTDSTLKILGDTASAMGKQIDQAVEAMADAVMGENERLKEFGIKSSIQGDKIAYTWSDASGRLKHIVIQNNAKIIQSTLNSIFNSKYAGAMEKRSQTFTGMLSNMSDNWTLFQKDLMDDGAFKYLELIIKGVSENLSKSYKDILDNEDKFTEGFNGNLKNLVLGVGTLANAFEGIAIFAQTAFYTVSAGWDALVVAIVGGAASLIDTLNKLPGVNIDNSWSKKVSEDAVNSFHKNIESINGVFDGLVDYEALANSVVKSADKAYLEFSKKVKQESKAPTKPEVKGSEFGAYKSTKPPKPIKLDTTAFDSIDNLIDKQLESIKINNTWANSFDGVTLGINNVLSAFVNSHKTQLNLEKKKNKLQETYAKKYIKLENSTLKPIEKKHKLKKLEDDFDKDSSKLKEQRQSAEIAGYADLAGAMGSAFEQGSAGAIAFQGIQATLGIVNAYTAITSAWSSAPFPSNMPAVAAASAAVIPIIGQLSSMGGSGGGSGGGSSISGATIQTSKLNTEMTQKESKPILDKLDRQIELLEIIGLKGTSSSVKLEQSKYTYETDIKLKAEEIIRDTQTVAVNTSAGTSVQDITKQWDAQYSKVNEELGAELYTASYGCD